MYTIYSDGELLFDSGSEDVGMTILAPKLSLDVNAAGSAEFVMLPGHAAYSNVRKLKSVITVYRDGELIFRGRAMDDEADFYNQKSIYCEGDRSFLMDSQCAPYKYTGTALGLLQKLIGEHNDQVEAEKRFTLGRVTAVGAGETMDVENVAYWETWREIDEKLLSVYGGYMMTRTEGGVTYLDWLEVSGRTSGQEIRFSVNLLDLKDKADAGEVFTILIPLGASEIGEDGEYTDPVGIASVNGGVGYIADDAAVEKYGKIWRTKTWDHIDDPAQLLEKGRAYMKMGMEIKTLTLHAIDMHFVSGDAEAIRVGEHVHIVSEPHGIDMTVICSKIDIDMLNPENTTYTFGEAPKVLTDNVVRAEKVANELSGSGGGRGGGGGKGIQEELKDYIRWAEIRLSEDEATIDLLTGEVSRQGERLSTAEIHLDGVNAQILLKADVEEVSEVKKRVTSAEIEIDGMNAEIVLKASQTIVDELGERVSQAEIDIDGANSEITLKANKVYVDAEITAVRTLIADEIDAAVADINLSMAETVVTNYLTVTGRATLSALALGGSNVQKTTIPIVTSFTQASGSAQTTSYTLLTTDAGNDTAHDVVAGATKTF